MNTLSDTDEGKPRPSLWPVYVAAAAIGLVSLPGCWLLGTAAVRFLLGEDGVEVMVLNSLYNAHSLFGIITAWAALRLRPWAWWCAVIWTAVFAVNAFCGVFLPGFGPSPFSVVVFCVLVWSLATRRQLFFPPKPEGEE